jgi:adenylosuccinate synthase
VTGAHILVDGQFGSTGKGAFASYLAGCAVQTGAIENFGGVISSGGPNSGHTSYFDDQKIVLKQLPTFAVHTHLMGHTIPIYLSAGAVINPAQLIEEANKYPNIPIYVHPCAAVVSEADIEEESGGSIEAIASTGSGTGAALARKVKREPSAVWKNVGIMNRPANLATQGHHLKPDQNAYFVEVSQGFSLGINTAEFYPHVTSRECTVMQAIADARIAPRQVVRTYMTIRTYPIRVGNTQYSSGGWYSDQEETSWEELGQTPELTTVTRRVRRVATWSDDQIMQALRANDPDYVALNFMNYLEPYQQEEMLRHLRWHSGRASKPFTVIQGHGPKPEDWWA